MNLREAQYQLLTQFRTLDFWLRVACVLVMLFSLSQVLLFAFGRDQSIYAAVADGILQGEVPYKDRWDFKPPGIFFLYALAQSLFGKVMWGIRVLEVVGLAAMAWSQIQLSRTFFQDTRPGYLAAAISLWVHAQFEFWHSGQPEAFAGMLTIMGLHQSTLAVRHLLPNKRVQHQVLAGLCFGLAFLLKPPFGGGAIVCAAYLSRGNLQQHTAGLRALFPFLTVGAASLVPIACCGLWFGAQGGLADLQWTLFEFTPGYTQLGWGDNAAGALYYATTSAVVKFSSIIAIGCVAAAVGLPLSVREREGLWLLLGLVAIHLAGIAMQAKYFPYHFSATVPLLGMLAGLGWFKIWRQAARQGAGGAVAFCSLLVVVASARVAVHDVPFSYWQRCGKRAAFAFGASEYPSRHALDDALYRAADYDLSQNRQVAKRLMKKTTAESSIYVWGFEPSVYWLSNRAPASRFLYNVPQRAKWERDKARQMLMAELQEESPAAIVVQEHDLFHFVTGDNLDSKRALPTFPELAKLVAEQYRSDGKVGDFEVFLRKTKAEGGPS